MGNDLLSRNMNTKPVFLLSEVYLNQVIMKSSSNVNVFLMITSTDRISR